MLCLAWEGKKKRHFNLAVAGGISVRAESPHPHRVSLCCCALQSDSLSPRWKIFQCFALKMCRDVNVSLGEMCIICHNQQNAPVDESDVTFSLYFGMMWESHHHQYSSSLMQKNRTNPVQVTSYIPSQNKAYISFELACGLQISPLKVKSGLMWHHLCNLPIRHENTLRVCLCLSAVWHGCTGRARMEKPSWEPWQPLWIGRACNATSLYKTRVSLSRIQNQTTL